MCLMSTNCYGCFNWHVSCPATRHIAACGVTEGCRCGFVYWQRHRRLNERHGCGPKCCQYRGKTTLQNSHSLLPFYSWWFFSRWWTWRVSRLSALCKAAEGELMLLQTRVLSQLFIYPVDLVGAGRHMRRRAPPFCQDDLAAPSTRA